MIRDPFKRNYARHLEISAVISMVCIIALFYFYPRFDKGVRPLPVLKVTPLKIVDIPRTEQKREPRLRSPAMPVIPVASDDPDILEDVLVEFPSPQPGQDSAAVLSAGEVLEVPFTPRQILEVMPGGVPGSKGKIRLSLRIGRDGRVREYNVLENSTTGNDALQEVIRAVEGSLWESVSLNNTRYEYWIEKTYIFD